MATENSNSQIIMERLRTKSSVKLQVYENTLRAFRSMKQIGREMHSEIKKEIGTINKKMTCSFKEKGDFEAELKIATDLIVMTMHTNVFEFPRDHAIMKTSYVKDDPTRSYSGIIYIYNFLADSIKYNRINDVGYLVGRIFINKENHFFVEGKRQLGFLFNNFTNEELTREKLKEILESAILYCIDFDLLTPSFENMKEVSVQEIVQYTSAMSLKTGKRLGFRFEADQE